MEIYQGLTCFLISSVFSFFSVLGGRDNSYLGLEPRIWKRLIAPIFFSVSVCLLAFLLGNFQSYMLLSIPTYVASTHVGYGYNGDSQWKKIQRRTMWSVFRVTCGLAFTIFSGAWILLTLQLVIAILVSNVLGVLNPLKAPQEEGLINFSSVFLIPFSVL